MHKKLVYGSIVLDKHGKSIVQTVDIETLHREIAIAHEQQKQQQKLLTTATASVSTPIVYRPLAIQPKDQIVPTNNKSDEKEPPKDSKYPFLATEDQDKFEVGLISRLPPTQDFTFECPYDDCKKLAFIESMVGCGIIRHGSLDPMCVEPIPPHATEAEVAKFRADGKIHNGCGRPLQYFKAADTGKEYVRPCSWELAQSESLR